MKMQKILASALMCLGAYTAVAWSTLPGSVPYVILFTGCIYGLFLIAKEKGFKKLVIPLFFWGLTLLCIVLFMIDIYQFNQNFFNLPERESWESFRWLAPTVLFTVAAVISTLVLMFKKK